MRKINFAYIGFLIAAASIAIYFFATFSYGSSSFIHYESPSRQIPIPLVRTSGGSHRVKEQLKLQFQGNWQWNDVDSIDLVFFSSQTHPRVTEAEITSENGCRFVASGPWFSIGNLLRFRHPDLSTIRFSLRNPKECAHSDGKFTLSLAREFDGQLGLWAHDGSVHTMGQSIQVVDTTEGLPVEANKSFLMGRVVTLKRGAGIAAKTVGENIQHSGPIFWTAFVLIFIVLAIHLNMFRPSLLKILLSLLSTCWAVSFCLILPPFQAADEPDHYLGLVGDPDGTALKQAQNTDFERIKFRYLESMASVDRAQFTDPKGWSSHVAPLGEYLNRSPLTAWTYSNLRSAFSMDYVNSARAVGLFILALVWLVLLLAAVKLKIPHIHRMAAVGLSLVCVPILYQASVVSNYSLLVSLSYGFGILVFFSAMIPENAAKSCTVAVMSALFMILIYSCSVNGISIIMLHAFFYLCLALYRLKNGAEASESRLFFLSSIGTLFVSSALLPAFISDRAIVSSVGSTFSPQYTQYLNFWLDNIRFTRCVPYVALLGLIFVIENLISNFSKRDRLLDSFKILLYSSVALGATALFCANAFFQFKMPFLTQGLPSESQVVDAKIGHLTYAFTTLKEIFLSLMGAAPDFMAVQSFWGGYGWLDMSLPINIVQLLMLVTAVGLLSTCWLPISKRIEMRGALAVLLLIGFCLAVGVTAIQCLKVGIDVVGRYLLMPYIVLVALSWMSLWNAIERTKSVVLIGLGLVVISLPITALLAILDRYYLILGGRM